MRIDIDTRGVSGASGLLEGMGRRARNLRPVWPKVIRTLVVNERTVFATRGRSIGKPWPELAASTRRIKGNDTPLVESGDLRGEVTSTGMVRARSGSELRVGSSQFYAKFVAKRRPFMGVSKVARRQIGRDVRGHLLP